MTLTLKRAGAVAAAVICALALGRTAAAQEKSEISITRQPGILYLPSHVIEKQKLIEKHAAARGLANVTTKWVVLAGGGAQTDALLSGNIDIVNTGTGNLLLLWDRTRGGVKGIVASSALPLVLVTRDPRIQSLKDFAEADKIAVPTVKVSTQAILLQMAAAQLFGPNEWAKLDGNTVQLSHPDAVAAMLNSQHEVRSHFAAPPFQYVELSKVPGARILIQSPEIIGGPLSQAQFFTTTRFADANPRIIEAIRLAAAEAREFIYKDIKASVDIYKEITGDRTSAEEILEMLKQPGMMEWNLEPQGTMKFAEHLVKVGTLKTRPASWKDYYLPAAHDLNGS